MDGSEFLQRRWTSKSSHRPLSASERSEGIFSSVIEPTAGLLSLSVPDLFHCGPVGSKSVGHGRARPAEAIYRSVQEHQSRLAVPLFGDEAVENLTFVIDGAPEITLLAIDPHEDLVEVAAPA